MTHRSDLLSPDCRDEFKHRACGGVRLGSPLPGALKIIDEWLANPELWEPWLPSEVETLLTDLREAIVTDTRESTPSPLPTDEDALAAIETAIAKAYRDCFPIVPTDREMAEALASAGLGFRRSVVATPPSEDAIDRAARAMYALTPQLSVSGARDLARAAFAAAVPVLPTEAPEPEEKP